MPVGRDAQARLLLGSTWIHFIMGHHTKDKGDEGLGRVLADLLSQGIQVALPLSEHLPFDLVAIDREGRSMRRVSVKYRKLPASGRIRVEMRSSWADRHGVHTVLDDGTRFDVLAVYCPDTHQCYYVLRSEIVGYGWSIRPSHFDPSILNAQRMFADVV